MADPRPALKKAMSSTRTINKPKPKSKSPKTGGNKAPAKPKKK